MAAASLRIINYLQPVLLRLQPILALKTVVGFMFSGMLVVGGAEVFVAVQRTTPSTTHQEFLSSSSTPKKGRHFLMVSEIWSSRKQNSNTHQGQTRCCFARRKRVRSGMCLPKFSRQKGSLLRVRGHGRQSSGCLVLRRGGVRCG